MTNANFNVIPHGLEGVDIEESLGNLDARGTTTSHFMGGFDPNKSSKNIGNLDVIME